MQSQSPVITVGNESRQGGRREQAAAPSAASGLGTAGGTPPMSASDLADLLNAFNEASGRLQQSHEALSAEVARLKGELAHANEQLERSRRLAALGEMAAGIAHEVRNPLGSIRLYARMLEQDLSDRPAEREIALKVARAVQGLDAVVGDVLSFAREIRPRFEPVEVCAALDHALDEAISGVSSGPGGEIRLVRLDRARRGVGTVMADASLLHRALVNVLRNAAEAILERGSGDGGGRVIVLDAVETRPAPGRAGSSCAIVIRDSGGGLSPEAMRRMFNPFFTTRAAGTGLGLAIVHRIVDAHEGRIAVRNVGAEEVGGVRVGAGARIEIELPERAGCGEGVAEPKGPRVGRALPAEVMEDC